MICLGLFSIILLSLLSVSVMSKNIIITGANRGLGLELVRQLSTQPTTTKIFALCRKTSAALTTLASSHNSTPAIVIVVEDVDVSQDTCVATLQSTFGSSTATTITPIDLLIHNAGAYGPPENFSNPSEMYASQTLDSISMDRMRGSIELNTLGPLRVTQALLPNLRASESSKVIIISSLMASLEDNTSGGHYGYRTAKAGANMIGKCLAEDLRNDNIAVGMVHPGYVLTGFQGSEITELNPGQRMVEPSVKGVLEAMDAITMETTGSFLHGNYGEGVKSISW